MTVSDSNSLDEFEAWWIADGWQLCCSLTQNKSSLIDLAELVWLAARENLLEKVLDSASVGAKLNHTGTEVPTSTS